MTAATPRHRAATLDRHDGPVALAAEILGGSADLRGAACADYARLFDVDVPAADLGHADERERWSAVQRVCRSCPVRGQCWSWATRLPGNRKPSGPTAASVNSPFNRGPAAAEVTPASADITPAVTETCTGKDCLRPVLARGLCLAHYRRYRRNPDQPRDHLLRPLRRSPHAPKEPQPEPGPHPRTPQRSRGARSRIRPSINRRK